MIKTVTGDVLAIEQGIIVHGCNCLGVMGAGIALQIRQRFPVAYARYIQAKEDTGLNLGSISVVEVAPNKFIVNALTQQSVGGGRPVSYDAITLCFEAVQDLLEIILAARGIRLPVVFPQIGAGLGGGSWPIISAIIDTTISDDWEKCCFILPKRGA